jgi:PKD repeat protein
MGNDLPDYFSKYSLGRLLPNYPNFGSFWQSDDDASVASAANQEFDVLFSDSSYIYFIDGISIKSSAYTVFSVVIEFNDAIIFQATVTGSVNIPFYFFPSLYFVSDDTLAITVTNLDASSRTIYYALSGTKYSAPANWARVPVASFSATPIWGYTPLTVQFTDASVYSPTKWEWNFNGLAYEEGSQNPEHIYTIGDIYSPKLKASNSGGFDEYEKTDYIKVYQSLDPSTLSKLDPNNRFSVSGNRVTITALPGNETAYMYSDYGLEYFDGFEIIFASHLTSIDDGWYYDFVVLNDSIANTKDVNCKYISCYYSRSGSTYRVQLVFMNLGSLVASDNGVISSDTTYYFKLSRAQGATTIYLYIYSDSAMTTLVDTLTITNALCNLKFRYLYQACSYNNGSTKVSTSWTEHIGVVVLD